jgi:hypothetical protein
MKGSACGDSSPHRSRIIVFPTLPRGILSAAASSQDQMYHNSSRRPKDWEEEKLQYFSFRLWRTSKKDYDRRPIEVVIEAYADDHSPRIEDHDARR